MRRGARNGIYSHRVATLRFASYGGFRLYRMLRNPRTGSIYVVCTVAVSLPCHFDNYNILSQHYCICAECDVACSVDALAGWT
ncbi:uncharacterized protein CC84DRAFT_703459 [Paraphaeosphaeria sporulosa]|uniref:Uncharacterized protein n=1 Tax=Paraphaeosphaeria sporulosa TaxID=1460663 RepID=A0A177CLD1_9PLEO|nr:uncharacterized protein CC84DRAFT_703459 [Paraphaeosphaeria sporulosa]OAG07629.1 hypothetical protein CC84DRAFT_703459 [Paraphaeosphaeria sporulosa]